MPLTALPHQTLAAALAARAAAQPEHVALRFEGRDFSYARLLRRSTRAAARLWHEWGVRPGDRVAYLGLNHVDQITLLWALARLGAVLVPLNFRLAEAEWRAVLADCTPLCLLHDAAWAQAATALGDAVPRGVHHVEALITRHAPGDTEALGQGNSPALLVYTSGTTGLPKGAVHTQANLLANARAAIAVQGLTAQDHVLTVLPLFHVGGLCIQTLPALLAGATVRLLPRFEPQACLHALAHERPTLTLQVPATLRALLAHPDWPGTHLASLRAVWAGSSVLPDDLVQAVQARGVPVCNVYGATETGPVSIALPPNAAFTHVGSCGWPAPGVAVALADAGADGVGELLLRAPNIVAHYWPERPALDADGWFHTGDLGRQAEDGSWRIVGRAKDMIIAGGENIYPAEIENVLAAHPAVAECAVFGLPDTRWGEVPVAAVVPKPAFDPKNPGKNTNFGIPVLDLQLSKTEQTALLQTLQAHAQAHLARYKLPRRWVLLPELPRTALGKVQKARLRAQLDETNPSSAGDNAP